MVNIIEDLLKILKDTAKNNRKQLPLVAVKLLKENFPHFDWVGIYNLEGDDQLILGPFLGKPTQHTRIKIDSGICGAAVREEKTIIVNDVNSDPRFIVCSIATKSEIVVPVFKDGKVVAEIDIDSDFKTAFTEQDKEFLEKVAGILSSYY